ncbi:MAG: hypothetical protein EBS55_09905 [Flavobacteriaceae bacterium]|nr:hypothetical protein [Flavobacteriaceae bacterium]
MEIKELESFYVNESSQTLEVTFRLLKDNDDEIRTDQIDLSESKTFGYDFFNDDSDDSWDDEDEDYFDDKYDKLEIDEEEIISFLNEYYLIYPNRLPEPQMY